MAERGGAQGRSLRNVTPGNRTSRRPPGSRRGTCVFGLVRHPRDASTSASLHPALVRVVRFRTRLPPSRVDIPTFGTHTPDVPYQPSSEMAWGPRGSEHMKSGADRDMTRRVRRRQRRCSVAPGPPVASRSWLYMAFNAAVALSRLHAQLRLVRRSRLLALERDPPACSAWTDFAGRRRENACSRARDGR